MVTGAGAEHAASEVRLTTEALLTGGYPRAGGPGPPPRLRAPAETPQARPAVGGGSGSGSSATGSSTAVKGPSVPVTPASGASLWPAYAAAVTLAAGAALLLARRRRAE